MWGLPRSRASGWSLRPPTLARAVVSVLGSWLRDHPQDFRDPPAHSDLGSVCTFLGWAAPAGPEAQEAEKLLGDFLEEAERKQEEEEQPEAWTGEGNGAQRLLPSQSDKSWAKFLTPSEPLFPHLYNGGIDPLSNVLAFVSHFPLHLHPNYKNALPLGQDALGF